MRRAIGIHDVGAPEPERSGGEPHGSEPLVGIPGGGANGGADR
jgi:hypothetical protein